MRLLLYTNMCLSCQWRKRLYKLKSFANDHGYDLVQIRTTYDRKLAQEARDLSNLKQPFIYNETNSKSVNFMTDNWLELIDGQSN